MFRKRYWIILNKNELERVINHLNRRADGVRERANILQQNSGNRNEKERIQKICKAFW
jgi:hypothetical protein